MANIQSQIKRNRQNEKRRLRNKAVRSEVRTHVRRVLEIAESGDAEQAEELLRKAQQQIDKAVSKGVMHHRTAARRKSRLIRQVRDRLG